MRSKKILITGAAGFIGSHLVEHLIHEGVKPNNLRLFVREGESLDNLPQGDFDVVYGDIRNKKDVVKALRGITRIYHLAAITRYGDGLYTDVNYNGTKVLVKECKKEGIEKFVFFSTIAVFGLPAFIGDRTDITESSTKMIVGEYAQSKYKAERVLVNAHKKWGLPYTIVRPTTVYGPRDRAGIFELIKAVHKGYFFRIGKGNNKMDYVYVGDVVKGARLAELSKKKEGDYILGAGRTVTFNEIVNSVAKSLNKHIPSFYIPKAVALTIGKLCDIVVKLFGVKLPLSADRVRVMTANYYFDTFKACNELGYLPRANIEDGVKETVTWLKNTGEI